MRISLHQQAHPLDSDLATPISLFLQTVGSSAGILLESVEQDGKWGRFSLVAHNFVLCLFSQDGSLALEYNDPLFAPLEEFQGMPFDQGLKKCMHALHIAGDSSFLELPPITRGLYGCLGYEFAGPGDPRFVATTEHEVTQSMFVLPRSLFLFDHRYNRLTELTLTNQDKKTIKPLGQFGCDTVPLTLTGPVTLSESQESFEKKTAQVQERIRQNSVVHVVLSVHCSAPCQGELFSAYRQLRKSCPSPYMFFMRYKDFSLAVSSPEVLVSCTEGILQLCPLTGPQHRDNGSNEDVFFEEELAAAPQAQEDHAMLVDLARNNLAKIAIPGSVAVDRFMEVENFSHTMHLTSYLRGRARQELDAVDIAAACFPTVSLTGVPQRRAMDIILEMENRPRGIYGGAIGWLGLDPEHPNLDLGLTTQSVWTRGGVAHWQVGAEIMPETEAGAPWTTCIKKSDIIHTILQSIPAPATAQGKE